MDNAPRIPSRIDILIIKIQKYEMRGMPTDGLGWKVSIATNSCNCLINFKEGTCVHVLVAKMQQRIEFQGWRAPPRVLVNQSMVKATTRATNRAANARTTRQGIRGRGRGRNRGTRGPGRPAVLGNAYQR